MASIVGLARESKTLEFKAELPRKADSDADSDLVPFIAGVSSLANTAGGDFVVGVAAKDGTVVAVLGITVPNVDAEKLRLEQALANGLEPRLLRIDIEAINCGADQYVLVIWVPRSWGGALPREGNQLLLWPQLSWTRSA